MMSQITQIRYCPICKHMQMIKGHLAAVSPGYMPSSYAAAATTKTTESRPASCRVTEGEPHPRRRLSEEVSSRCGSTAAHPHSADLKPSHHCGRGWCSLTRSARISTSSSMISGNKNKARKKTKSSDPQPQTRLPSDFRY